MNGNVVLFYLGSAGSTKRKTLVTSCLAVLRRKSRGKAARSLQKS
jgi:hypothetical protein